MNTNYEIVKKVGSKVLASDGEKYFVCSFDESNNTYSRYCGGSEGVTVQSRDLDYVAIGAKTFKTKRAAAKRLAA